MAPLIPSTEQDKDVIRLLLQTLNDLGFNARKLEQESGLCQESNTIGLVREYVEKGNWDRLDQLVCDLELIQIDPQEFRFLIRKQKYLELLEVGQVTQAIQVLQKELTSLKVCIGELHQLSKYLFLSRLALCSFEEIKVKTGWDGQFGRSRHLLLENLMRFISPSMCIPPKRLYTLLDQALQHQISKCMYHNSTNVSGLLTDYTCSRDTFPTFASHVFEGHEDEVWFMSFSHDGTKLASASRDARAIIWDVEKSMLMHILDDHKNSISYLAWSPDDQHLLTASNDKTLKLWDTMTGNLVRTFSKHTDLVTCCAWLPNGEGFISGSVEKNLYQWRTDGSIVHQWSGFRTMDLALSTDGNQLVACCEKKIRIFDMESKSELYSMLESDSITSLSFSKDDRHLLVNLSVSEVHLWDLKEKRVIKKYYGQKQGRYVIRGCLGGIYESFVLSGSEDANVYVWHRESGTVIERLGGHSACVNCVTWNPKVTMFASASDDHQIRIWRPNEQRSYKLKTE